MVVSGGPARSLVNGVSVATALVDPAKAGVSWLTLVWLGAPTEEAGGGVPPPAFIKVGDDPLPGYPGAGPEGGTAAFAIISDGPWPVDTTAPG